VRKTYVVYEKDTLKIIDKQLLYTDTILYLENGSSIRISKDLLYYYAHQVYLKFKYNKKYNKYTRL
jgi:Tfp pilus assembly protein PilZ